MIHQIQKTYESQTGHKGPQAGLIRFNLPVGNKIKSVHIRAAQNVSPQNIILNIRINGVDVWAGDARPTIIAGTAFVTMSGLDIAVSQYDLVVLDVIQTGTSTMVTPITMIVEVEDGILAAEQEISTTTASIANGASATGVIALGKSFQLKRIVADKYSRITLYKTSAQRSADSSRPFGDTSFRGDEHGIICDLNLTAGTGLDWLMSPDAIGSNGDEPNVENVYYRITNNSGSTGTVSADFTVVKTEL